MKKERTCRHGDVLVCSSIAMIIFLFSLNGGVQAATLVGHWKFDESAEATIAVDSSAYDEDGTLVNMDTDNCWVDGQVAHGLQFDGDNDYVYVTAGSNSPLNLTDAVTVSAWVKPDTRSGIRQIGGKAGYCYMLAVVSGKVYFYVGNSGHSDWQAVAVGETVLDSTRWYHVAGTFDTTDHIARVYVNGVEDGFAESTNAGLIGSYTSNFNIGVYPAYSPQLYMGMIDDVRVYDGALSQPEIQAMMREWNVKSSGFGATGDGTTDDTAAIQGFINAHLANGGQVYFPEGTYIVTSVNIKHGLEIYGETAYDGSLSATIKKKASQGKFSRTFTTQNNQYSGTTDSPLLYIHDLDFDGNRASQGVYGGYELQQQHMIFLQANTAQAGRLNALVENCNFHDGVADGVSIYVNVNVIINDCTANQIFRAGICLTGGYSVVTVNNYISTSTPTDENDPPLNTGFHIEVDGAGYGSSYQTDVTVSNLDLEKNFTQGGRSSNSTITGDHITLSGGGFCLTGKGFTIDLSDCTFSINSSGYVYFPENITFTDCTFTCIKPDGDSGTVFKPINILWSTDATTGTNETLTFNNCNWTIGAGIVSTDTCYAIYSNGDVLSRNNQLIVQGSETGKNKIDSGYDYGIYTVQGGKYTITDTHIGAAKAIQLGSTASSPGYYLDATIDGVVFDTGVTTSEYITVGYSSNNITHTDVVVTDAMNTLGTTYGLTANTYHGGRHIDGTRTPTSQATPGLVGDVYHKSPSTYWNCTASSTTSATWVLQ